MKLIIFAMVLSLFLSRGASAQDQLKVPPDIAMYQKLLSEANDRLVITVASRTELQGENARLREEIKKLREQNSALCPQAPAP